MRRPLPAALLLAALAPAAARAGELQDDLKARRARAMERLGPDAMLILRSAPSRTYSRDVEYEYRQDSNLYYLTGIDQEETTLVLMPGNAARREILFIRERDPIREHWAGRRLSADEATAASGIETVYTAGQLEPFLASILAGRAFRLPPPHPPSSDFDAFLKSLRSGRARVALVLEPKPLLSEPLPPIHELAEKLRERYVGFALQDATDLLRDLRQVKTPCEQRLLERSLAVSNEAHLAGMRAARPGAFEYTVQAAIEEVYGSRGALGPGYPSIVGSGPNATILHYAKSSRRLEPGDLILVDAAANLEYMTGDVTRTYPVDGSFSETQREIYRLVLAAQEEGMKAARSGGKLDDVHQKTLDVMKAGLLKLGLITDPAGTQYLTWYTHGSTHFIGIDVHDVGDRDRPLEPGMAFVIEPGLYIREGALDRLPPTPENAAFAEKVRPAYERYKNIGVRIEDSFLLTPSGLNCLSCAVPRTLEEVEAFLKGRPSTP